MQYTSSGIYSYLRLILMCAISLKADSKMPIYGTGSQFIPLKFTHKKSRVHPTQSQTFFYLKVFFLLNAALKSCLEFPYLSSFHFEVLPVFVPTQQVNYHHQIFLLHHLLSLPSNRRYIQIILLHTLIRKHLSLS